MMIQSLTERIEEGAIVMKLDGIHGAAGLVVAHILGAIGLKLLELALQLCHLASGVAHGAAQVLRRSRSDLVDGLKALGLHHDHATIGPLARPVPRTASRLA